MSTLNYHFKRENWNFEFNYEYSVLTRLDFMTFLKFCDPFQLFGRVSYVLYADFVGHVSNAVRVLILSKIFLDFLTCMIN